ncbi:MAG TPA: TRAM domain-containing protein, partial [Candidatus Avanaerovorax faecigallinarum]|nr:TRAM domain-containing protein [Candidatus Avanaerovorax faecigallinarum]
MEKRKKGETVKVKIVDMADSGAGIGKDAGFAVFVPGAVTGDVVTARLVKVKKNFAEGELISVDEPSKDRREPFCPAAGECGGCPFGTLAYEAQAEIRKKHLSDRLERIGGAQADGIVGDTVTMEDPFRYRNKAVMEITAGGLITLKGGIQKNAGEPVIGFHRRKSHDVVDCGDCMLQAPTVAAAARAVKEFMISDNITAYDPKWEKGLMRHMMIRT